MVGLHREPISNICGCTANCIAIFKCSLPKCCECAGLHLLDTTVLSNAPCIVQFRLPILCDNNGFNWKLFFQKLQEFGHTEPSNGLQAAFEDMLTIKDKNPSLKRSNLLDESFLECPKCKVQYPTSQHRELLAHIDFCAD